MFTFTVHSQRTDSDSTPSHSMSTESDDPIPPGWAMSVAPNGRIFYINHNTKQTTWVSTLSLVFVNFGHTKAVHIKDNGV